MSPRDQPLPSVVILVADGARPDTLAAAMDAGALPALARLRAEGGMQAVTSVFPSVTGPAYTPFLMGRYPGPMGLPGIRWYDRERTQVRWPPYARSYVGFGFRHVGRDLDANAPTLFELASPKLGALSVIERGLRRHERVLRGAGLASRAGFAVRAALTHFRGDVRGWLDMDRRAGSQLAVRMADEQPQFAFGAFTGIDKASHSDGHDSPAVREAMQIVDHTAARIRDDAERDGRWNAMHLWIVSDHGHSPVLEHEDLAGLLAKWGVRTLAHPWIMGVGHRAAVMVSGNAMAHLYLDLELRARPWWPALAPRWEWLAERLLERPATDLLLLPINARTTEIRTRARGRAHIVMEHGRYSYLPETGDPLGVGPLHDLDADTAHDAMRESDYPDALVQVALLAASSRCGDLLISAARNWDLRAKWEPIPHVSSHGALHRDHMQVPLLVNRPFGRAPRRTVDVFATAVAAIGASVPSDGQSWLTG